MWTKFSPPYKVQIFSSAPRFRKLSAHVLPLNARDQASYPFIKKNPTGCNNVSKFIIPYLH
jgi:hypothetical protein